MYDSESIGIYFIQVLLIRSANIKTGSL